MEQQTKHTLIAILQSQLKIEKIKEEAYLDCKNLVTNHHATVCKKVIFEIENQLMELTTKKDSNPEEKETSKEKEQYDISVHE